ncbi:MAG: hypothetical protein NZ929_02605 [Aigarchaeota archaeon]|nr:hypothetical protein [Aigarchaeota archaeon]
MKINKRAISAIIGTTIALTIVFAIIIPLFIYMQSLQSLFMQEANRRLQYELERLNERLEVYTTICGGWGTSELNICIVICNPGMLSVAVPTIYGESYRYGLIREEKNLLIVPGEKKVVQLEKIAFNPNLNDTINVKLITLRGNSFVSKNIIGPRNLPYILVVTLGKMSIGYKYEVKVEMVGEHGCVSSESGQACQAYASQEFIPQSSLDRNTVAAFMIAPGNYTVSLSVYNFATREIETLSQQFIELFDDTVIRLNATVRGPSLETIPLRIRTSLSDGTVILMQGDETIITMPYVVSLGNQSEPLRNVKITIEVNSVGVSSTLISPGSKMISRLSPGESYYDYFMIQVKDDDGAPSKFGGYLEYNIMVKEATGEFTGKQYQESSIELPSLVNKIILCRLYKEVKETEKLNVLVCEAS